MFTRKTTILLLVLVFSLGLWWGSYRMPSAYATTVSESINVESSHPYSNNYDYTWTITRSNATRMRVHFSYIQTESNYDYVYVKNGTTTVNTYTGSYSGIWSGWVGGKTIQIRLTSDNIFTYNGFVADMLEYVLASGNYSIRLRISDWSGNVLALANVTVSGAGNFSRNMLSNSWGWANFTQNIFNSTYRVTTRWQGNTVNQTSITVSGSSVTTTIRSRVYSLNFANSFKDSIGNTLYTPPSSFKLVCPNGTTTSSLSIGSYRLQNGTFTVNTITWNSTDITPSPSPTFDPTNGNPTILTKVFPHRNMPRPYDWPLFQQNPGHTGNTSSTAPTTNTTLWTYTTSGTVWSSPAVADGRVLVGSFDDKVYAINATTGAKIWEFPAGGDVYSSPAVYQGRVFVGSYNGSVYCLNAATGTRIWNYPIYAAIYSSPVVAGGRVFVSANYKVYCLNATSSSATLLWSYSTGTDYVQYSSPAVAYGRVYVGAGNYLYVLNATATSSSGQLIWRYNFGSTTYYSSPTIYDGRVYIGAGSYVYALNATISTQPATYLWRYSTGSTVWSSPAIAYGRVYVGSLDYYVYALNATTTTSTGQLLWRYKTGSYVYSSPAVAEGKVYVGSHDDKVYSLNASTGSFIWSYTTGNDVLSSPAVADGRVYIGSYDGKVYAFGPVTVSLNLRTVDWSGSVLPSCNVTVVGIGSTISSVKGWANFTVQSGTYIVIVKWQESKVNQTSVMLSASSVTMDVRCGVYSLSFSFKDSSGSYAFTPSQVTVQAPNGTLRTLTSYTISRAQNGTWTITRIRWQGSNVVPTPNPTKALTGSVTWTVNSRVYQVDFSKIFHDSIGNMLFTTPSNFTLIMPNGTSRSSLFDKYLIQNGTYTVKNVFWLGADVTPSPLPSFDPKDGTATIYLKIASSENMEEPYDWPIFHHNLGHTGQTTSPLSDTMSLNWIYSTGGSIQSSPTVSDGIVFFGSNDYKVYALNASTGKKLWTFSTGGSVYSSPTVVDGVVYVGSTDSYVYAINATTGKQKWKYYIGSSIYSSPTLADGKVYVAANYYVYALNATTSVSTGEKLWVSKSLGYMYYSSPAIAYDMIYVGAGSYVYALNSTGGVVWSRYTGDTMYYSTPSVYDGKVYIGGYSKLYCLNATTTNSSGEEVWSYSLGTSTYPSPAVADGKVYFASGYRVYAVDANDGSDVWDYYTSYNYAYYSSPAIACGKLIVGAGYYVYGLNTTDGSYLWSYYTGGSVYSSPAIANGMVYVGSNDNKLYAFGPTPHYSLTFKFMDNGGNDDLTADISWILVQSPTGKTLNLTSYTLPQADSGIWTLTKIAYMKTNVIPSGYQWSSTITLTSDYTWTINCRIYVIDFTNTFQDNDGSSLYANPSNFTLLKPDGKAISTITVGKYYLWNGTWTWKSIFWEGSDVSPTYTSTFNPENGNPTINCKVYKVDFANTFQDPQGARLNPNPDNFRLLCPNGTTTQKLSLGSYQLQPGTYTFKDITWQGQDVTPSPPTTFDPTSNRNPTTKTKTVKIQTTISCQLSRTSITSGESLTISGSISTAVSAQVTIQISTDGGTTWSNVTKVTSSSSGSYSYTWTPQSTGTYRVRSAWSGNAQYLSSTSNVVSLTVSASTGPPSTALPMPLIFGGIGIVVIIAVIAAAARRRKPKVVVPPPLDPRIRLAKCRNALTKLEELNRQGKVSERVYRELKAEYEAEAAELERKLADTRRK